MKVKHKTWWGGARECKGKGKGETDADRKEGKGKKREWGRGMESV